MIPTGIITLWYGAIVDIPDGWLLCDGNNGTPDLRNRFVIGAGLSYAVGATGGSAQHNHDFTGDGHHHEIVPGTDIASGPNYAFLTALNSATGTTDLTNHLPPYHALCYIMKT